MGKNNKGKKSKNKNKKNEITVNIINNNENKNSNNNTASNKEARAEGNDTEKVSNIMDVFLKTNELFPNLTKHIRKICGVILVGIFGLFGIKNEIGEFYVEQLSENTEVLTETETNTDVLYEAEINTEEELDIVKEDEQRSTEEPPENVEDLELDESKSEETEMGTNEEADASSDDIIYEPISQERIDLISEEIGLEQIEEKIIVCLRNFDDIITERKQEVTILEEMPDKYEDYVMEANEIYESYKDYLEYDQKQEVMIDAASTRDLAKQEYRQESNEQIVGNYYAKCGINAHNNGYADQEYKHYTKAIDYYYDAYAVSLKTGNIKHTALEYIATCFYNIAKIEDIDTETKEKSFLAATAMYEKYKESPDAAQLETNLNIGRCYSRLCLSEKIQEEKYYCFEEAVKHFEYSLGDSKCGETMTPIVYDELIHMYQYCYDHIDEELYSENWDKESIMRKHDEYVTLREKYDRNPYDQQLGRNIIL